MMSKLSWATAVLATSLLANPATAYCRQPTQFPVLSFEASVDKWLDYLLCLHNEQVTSLNNHATMINDLADTIDQVRSTVGGIQYNQTTATVPSPGSASVEGTTAVLREIVVRYDAMRSENEQLQRRVEALEAQVAHMAREAGE